MSDVPPQRPADEASLRAELSRVLREQACDLGFSQVGIVRAALSQHGDALRAWLERGMHGDMAWMADDTAVARRASGVAGWSETASIVVVAHDYHQPDAPGVPDDPSMGVIARYARGRDYHKVVKQKLTTLLRSAQEWAAAHGGPPLGGRAYVDTGPLLERELGQRAGLGWFGRNTMLISPERGSYFFLGALLLDVELDPDLPFEADRCGTCTRCLDACPTGALLGRDEHGAPVIDARRCISYLTIEHRGPIPEELRPLIGNRIYGCDICQEVCPWNGRVTAAADEGAYAARGPGAPPLGVEPDPGSSAWHPGTSSPSLIHLLETALNPESWDSFSRGSAIRRAGRAGFARNVCVALGNWGSAEAVPVLTAALSDPDPLVPEHAAWALARATRGP